MGYSTNFIRKCISYLQVIAGVVKARWWKFRHPDVHIETPSIFDDKYKGSDNSWGRTNKTPGAFGDNLRPAGSKIARKLRRTGRVL